MSKTLWQTLQTSLNDKHFQLPLLHISEALPLQKAASDTKQVMNDYTFSDGGEGNMMDDGDGRCDNKYVGKDGKYV